MQPKLLLLVFKFFLQIKRSIQFASWFVERSSSCYTNVRDTSEVVMNNFIVPYDHSSHPEISIEIYDSSMNPLDAQIINGKKTLYQNKSSETYILKLKNAQNVPDLQYIMDVRVEPILDDDQVQQLNGSDARFQAKFVSPAKGCHDHRAHGRGADKGLQLYVHLPDSVYESSSEELGKHSVDIVSAWACGHEPVTLTQSIFIMPKPVVLGSDKVNVLEKNEENEGGGVGGGDKKGKYTANSYLTGLIVMIVVGGSLINAFLAMSRPRQFKNKRKI